MMLLCGNTVPALRDLLRQIVGFPDTLDDRLAAPGYREGYCVSVALFAACGTGDLELVRAILPMEGVSLGDNLSEQWTLLFAAMKDHRDILHLIIDPDNLPDNFTAEVLDLGLLACVMIGDLQLTCSLLREGTEPRWNLRESIPYMLQGHSNSFLRAACTLANVEMVKLLLNNPWCCAQVTTSELRQDLPRHHEQSCELECACQPVRSADLPDMPPASDEDNARRVEVTRLLLAAVADATDCGPLYVHLLRHNYYIHVCPR
jgi:hypothetical protein